MQPLSGLKVLDFSTLLPGPLATLILAEAGAEVSPFLEGFGLTDGNPICAAAPGVAEALRAIAGF